MREILAGEVVLNSRDHPFPPAGFDQTENWDKQRAEPDQKKLQNFVEDRGKQAACCHINGYGDRRYENAEVEVPPEDDFHHHSHGVHVYARHQDGHDCESDGAQPACRRTVA